MEKREPLRGRRRRWYRRRATGALPTKKWAVVRARVNSRAGRGGGFGGLGGRSSFLVRSNDVIDSCEKLIVLGVELGAVEEEELEKGFEVA